MPRLLSPRFYWRLFRNHPWWSSSIFILLAAVVVWQFETKAENKITPLLATVSRGDIENKVAAAGSLQPSNSVEVGAQVSGQLEKLEVEVGDVVEAGQLLASIDASIQIQQVEASRANLQAQEAQLQGRQAALDLAELNVKRQRNMIKDQATSQQELDTAINTLISAQSSLAQLQAQIAQSRASLASAEAELGYSKIYAPMAGTVVSINVKEGQTLNAAQSAPLVMTIADLTTMTVETDVSEADVGKLKPHMPVYFTTLGNGNRRWKGTLRQILPTPEITNNVVLYTALFDVDNHDATLLSGMTAQVFFISSSARDVLTIPVAALNNIRPIERTNSQRDNSQQKEGSQTVAAPSNQKQENSTEAENHSRYNSANKPYQSGTHKWPKRRMATVQVVDQQGNSTPRDIVIGITGRVLAEVLSGLEEGEQVVSGIAERVEPGNNQGRPPMRMGRFH